MSRFIDLVETFDFTTLRNITYREKIDGLLKRFPKYDNDERFRTVLPHKFPKTADDYVSMKLCTRGRYPIYGIYDKRDLNLVAVCVEGNIMYALDDCDLHASLVPDLNVRKLHLGIQDSDLATRETPSFTKAFMCSAISTLSLGYTPEKKSEWCEAIVLLTGMTTQAVRFHKMKRHIIGGLRYVKAYDLMSYDGRYEQNDMNMALQSRWNKISKALRRGELPLIFSYYTNYGYYNNNALCHYLAHTTVSLINDKDKRKREKFKRRTKRWNGPLGNSIRKRKEERTRRCIMEREEKRIMQEKDNKFSEKMHGFWCGSVDTFKYEVHSVDCLARQCHVVRAFASATRPPDLQDVLQVRTNLDFIYLALKDILKDGGLMAFFQALRVPMHREIVDCRRRVFRAAADFYPIAKRHKVSNSLKNLSLDHFGISKEKIVPEKVIWNRDTRQFVQGRRIWGANGACDYPLQCITTRMQAQNSNVNVGHSEISSLVFWRTLRHGDLRGFCSSQAADKRIRPYTCKTLAQTKKEQHWCYDPTVKYESLRQCAVRKYAFYDDSATDWSDSSSSPSSDSEIETDSMTVEEAQTQKDIILAEAKKELPFTYDPYVNYELLKEFVYIDSPDSFASPPSDSETETPEEVESKINIFHEPDTLNQIFLDRPNNEHLYNPSDSDSYYPETETKTEEGTLTHDAGVNDEQLFSHDPSIKYVPLKRYIVPRFAFFDSSSTDWSDSSDSASASSDDEILAESTEEQLFRENLVESLSTDLQLVAKDLIKSPSTSL
ncbi:hypothetical protein POM88_051367 [Heracleum sosnowskyi]|uniref:Uncharacterized protein n=1 Tax=Heracleum sosnowskyi TaxID=360622 RepID=A0AAD8M2C6_9APIA|nr:hypothetical protein POM88_051367 [Heracleum sosnowskyi]